MSVAPVNNLVRQPDRKTALRGVVSWERPNRGFWRLCLDNEKSNGKKKFYIDTVKFNAPNLNPSPLHHQYDPGTNTNMHKERDF